VEDITASIWQYNLHNLSGEVLGLHNKMNQLKSQETRLRQVSREAAEFTSLQESAKRSLSQISEIASAATTAKASLQGTAEEINGMLAKVSEQGQKVASIAAQIDQHETTATQQLAGAKQATADTEAIAKKAKELQTEIEASREALRDLSAKAQELISSTQSAVSIQLSGATAQGDELVSTTTASVSNLTTRLDGTVAEFESKATQLIADTTTKLAQLQTGHDTRFSSQLQEFASNSQTRQQTYENRLANQLREFTESSEEQLTSQRGAFNTQVAEWTGNWTSPKRNGTDRRLSPTRGHGFRAPFCILERRQQMVGRIKILGQKARRGERMTRGNGWRLAMEKGRKRVFIGTLLQTINYGDRRLAIFSVPK
jgi:uncharacterized protein YdbL (DUF1318 family)